MKRETDARPLVLMLANFLIETPLNMCGVQDAIRQTSLPRCKPGHSISALLSQLEVLALFVSILTVKHIGCDLSFGMSFNVEFGCLLMRASSCLTVGDFDLCRVDG